MSLLDCNFGEAFKLSQRTAGQVDAELYGALNFVITLLGDAAFRSITARTSRLGIQADTIPSRNH
jgi:hypothetical protein